VNPGAHCVSPTREDSRQERSRGASTSSAISTRSDARADAYCFGIPESPFDGTPTGRILLFRISKVKPQTAKWARTIEDDRVGEYLPSRRSSGITHVNNLSVLIFPKVGTGGRAV